MRRMTAIKQKDLRLTDRSNNREGDSYHIADASKNPALQKSKSYAPNK